MYGMRRRQVQNRDRFGRVHQLWSRHVLLNTSRNHCRDMPRLSRRSNFTDRKFVD
jgi:hypothetical protein